MEFERTTLEDIALDAHDTLTLLGCSKDYQITDIVIPEVYGQRGYVQMRTIPLHIAERVLSFVKTHRTLEDIQVAYKEHRKIVFHRLMTLNESYYEELKYNDEYLEKGRCEVKGFTARWKGEVFGYSTLFKGKFHNYAFTQTLVESLPVMLSHALFPGDFKITVFEPFFPHLEEYSRDVLNVDRLYVRPHMSRMNELRKHGYARAGKGFEFPCEGIVGQERSRAVGDVFYKDL
jgi:hypothetical protein